MPTKAPENRIGLTAVSSWDGNVSVSPPLTDQLHARGVQYGTHDLPLIVGMGGCARLICHTSPRTGRPVTVLAVPHQSDIDQFAEDYYYFEGLAEAEALAGDVDARWAALYDRCLSLATRREEQ